MSTSEMAGTVDEANAQTLVVPAPCASEWFEFAHLLDGYAVAEQLGTDLADLANTQEATHRATSAWPGSLLELRLALFFQARALRFAHGLEESPDHQALIANLLNAIASANDERQRDQEPEPPAAAPDVLAMSIGGYPGPWYAVEWRDGRLEYDAAEYAQAGFGERTELTSRRYVRPTGRQWTRFWNALDKLDVWNWDRDYVPPGLVLDGTNWSVDIELRGRRLRSGGSNAYPGSRNTEPSKEFRAFLRSIRTLLGSKLPFA